MKFMRCLFFHAKIKTGAALVEDLGADSLDMVEVQMALEEEFGE